MEDPKVDHRRDESYFFKGLKMIKNIRPGGKGSFTEDYELQLNVPGP